MSQAKPKPKPIKANKYAKNEQEAIRRADEWLQNYSKAGEFQKELNKPTACLIADLVAFLRSKPQE